MWSLRRLKGELLLKQSPSERNGAEHPNEAMRHELTNQQSADQERSARDGLGIGYSNDAEAQSFFEHAIAIAPESERPIMGVTCDYQPRVLARQASRRDEARAMLTEIYDWFTEGFDTANFKDAKALIEELN